MSDILAEAREYLATHRPACAYVEDCVGVEARAHIEALLDDCERLALRADLYKSMASRMIDDRRAFDETGEWPVHETEADMAWARKEIALLKKVTHE